MRTTRASAAIDRLKRRSGDAHYSMTMSQNGLFCLVHPNVQESTVSVAESTIADAPTTPSQPAIRLCQPMPLEEFVAFVNAYGPQTPKRISQLEVTFSAQLAKAKRK